VRFGGDVTTQSSLGSDSFATSLPATMLALEALAAAVRELTHGGRVGGNPFARTSAGCRHDDDDGG